MQTIVTHRICSSFEIANPRPFRGAGLYQNGHKPTAFASLWAIMRLSTAALITNTFQEAMRPSAFTSTSDTAGQNPPTQPAVDECLQTASHAIRTRDLPPARPKDSLSARSTGCGQPLRQRRTSGVPGVTERVRVSGEIRRLETA